MRIGGRQIAVLVVMVSVTAAALVGNVSRITGSHTSGTQSTTGSDDQSGVLSIQMQSSDRLQSLLAGGYIADGPTGSVAISVQDVSCERTGSSQRYTCTVDYSVQGSAGDDGQYQLGADASCNGAACQWQLNPVASAVRP